MTAGRRLAAVPAGVLAAVLVAGALAGCTGGDGGEERAPVEVLRSAKQELDATSGVRVGLRTDELPEGVDGIVSATGVGTHDPAFEGDLKVATGGLTADVPVVAAQGKVFAQLPFTTEFVEVDPADYAAPDPAQLMATDGGLSSLLTAVRDPQAGEPVRSGEDVLTSYSGTVPGRAVRQVLPSARPRDDFEATFTVDDADRLREARLTGPFYPGAGDLTYSVTFEDYGISPDIRLP